MTKAECIADPNSCWNKAKDDEPVFILLGRDEDAPATIEYWLKERYSSNPLDKKIKEAANEAGIMRHYQRRIKEESQWQTIKVYLGGKYVFVKVRELVSVPDHTLSVCEAMQRGVHSLQCRLFVDNARIPSWFIAGTEFAIYSAELKGNFIVSDNAGYFRSNGEYQLTPKEATK